MKTFRTTDGLEWQIAVNVATVKRVRDLAGVDLLAVVDDAGPLQAIFGDHVKFSEVLCAAVRPQLADRDMGDDEFFATIDGAVIEAAAEALIGEIVDFFQEPRKGLLKKALAKYQEALAKVNSRTTQTAEAALDQIDFEQMILAMPTSFAGASPGSAG
jgi:hypothetical protein